MNGTRQCSFTERLCVWRWVGCHHDTFHTVPAVARVMPAGWWALANFASVAGMSGSRTFDRDGKKTTLSSYFTCWKQVKYACLHIKSRLYVFANYQSLMSESRLSQCVCVFWRLMSESVWLRVLKSNVWVDLFVCFEVSCMSRCVFYATPLLTQETNLPDLPDAALFLDGLITSAPCRLTPRFCVYS